MTLVLVKDPKQVPEVVEQMIRKRQQQPGTGDETEGEATSEDLKK